MEFPPIVKVVNHNESLAKCVLILVAPSCILYTKAAIIERTGGSKTPWENFLKKRKKEYIFMHAMELDTGSYKDNLRNH